MIYDIVYNMYIKAYKINNVVINLIKIYKQIWFDFADVSWYTILYI